MRWFPHQVGGRLLQTKTECGGRAGQHVDPEDTDRAQRENTAAIIALEAEADYQQEHFGDVGREQVENESLDVGKESATFTDGHTD